MSMAMDIGARSDTGRIRENNEDCLLLAEELNLFVLSDGMGGVASGEVASHLATETIVSYLREAQSDPYTTFTGRRIEGISLESNLLVSAIRLANREVYERARRTDGEHGMGATVVAVWFNDTRMSVAHVGDSRGYRLRAGTLEQLTRDHSFVAEQVCRGIMTAEEAQNSQMQNVLTRALGVDPEVEVEINEDVLLDDDTILLCSDGLTRELTDAQIAAVLVEDQDAAEAAGKLIELANQAGGGDNISAIVLRNAPKLVGVFGQITRIGKWFKGSRD